MDEFIPVSPIPGSVSFDTLMHSPVSSRGPTGFTERSGSYLNSLINAGAENIKLSPNIPCEEKYNPSSETMVPPVSFVGQDPNAGMVFPLPSLGSIPYGSETTNCEQCDALISNNEDAIMSHLQRCSPADDQLSGTNTKKIDQSFVDIKPNTSAISITYNGDEQVVQVNWEKYMRTLQVKSAPDYSFPTKSYTFEVPGLDPGMKLEAIDKNNPQSFCVATIVEVVGHRVRIRYDGYGRDSSNDFWCNFQAEELYPIGWCAQNSFPLQPPTGINCTLEEWRKFLTQTLTGALAAPKQLFPSEHYQPKVHAFQIGMKMEVIHPTNPYVFCAATVVKSLGPYYFLVATDKTDKIPSVTMCCHSETSTIFPPGWSYKNGIEFTVPSGYTRKTFSWEKYVASSRAVYAPQHLFKKSKPHKFRAGQKLEAVDIEQPYIIRVATITNVMGRVLQLFFDGQTRFQFVECDSPDIHGSGWCKRTGHPLFTPYGKAPFRTVTKYEGLESGQKPLKLISFADVMGRNPTLTNVANPSNLAVPSNEIAPSNQAVLNLATMPNQATLDVTTPSNLTAPSNQATPSNPATSSSVGTPSLKTSFNSEASPDFQVTSPNLATSSNFASTPNVATLYVATSNVAATTPSTGTSTSVAGQPCLPDPGLSGPENPGASSSLIEPDENGEDKNEKCPTLSPSDDDEDLSDEDGNCTGSERFYHNKNQIFFNKTCCCGPLLNLEEIKLLPDATEPGKVSTVIRIGLEMVAKCANEPERVLEMMQEGSGVRLTVKHNGKVLKKAITRVDSRPKLERYLKRFCRRLVCCEYFLSLTPVGYPCPDDCKADQYGNLQGPKGMKAKRAREYFETKHLGYEKKRRGRKTKAVANEAAAQRAAAGIVTSVFHKGNHVPLPNLNLPVNAIADHLRNTATKILHQVQASQGLSSERSILHTKAAASSNTVVAQITASPITPTTPHLATTHLTTPHPTIPNTAIPSNTAHQPTAVVPPALTTHPITPGTVVPTYGKPRLLPSPYGPPPLPVTTTTTVANGATTGNGRNGLSRVGRAPNQPPPKKIIRPIIPAGPLPDGTVPLVEIPIKIPPANKLPLPSRSMAIPVTTITVSSDTVTSSLTASAKPVFRLAPPKFVAVPQSSNGITTTTFSGRLVALPRSLATGASFTRPNLPNSSSQTTTLVTANRRPIPASISLTRSGPPPLIPARAISGTPANPKAISQSVQLIRPRLVERKVVSAAPNVCVTERGTIVAAQLNKTSGTSSGACVVNPVVGHSPDANAMMKKMFSVVRGTENCIPISIAPAKVVASVNRTVPTQFSHIYPNVNTSVHDQKTNNSHQNTTVFHQNTNVSCQNTNVSHQNTNVSHQNTNNSHQSTNVSHQNTKSSFNSANKSSENTSMNKTNQSTNRPNQNTYNSYQRTNKFDGNTNGTNNITVKFDKSANNYSQTTSTIKRYSLNVGGGMGAVTTAVRSGMLARENYKSPEGSRDSKHNITREGGYSVKINENNLETKTGVSGIHSTVTKISDLTANQFENIPKGSERSPNQSVTTPNSSNVSPADSEEYPMVSEGQPNNEVRDNEPQPDADRVGMNKQRSAWLHRRRKKKKVRFTYVKGKNKKKKEEENEVVAQEQVSYGFDTSDGFVQGYDERNGSEIDEQQDGRAIKREHDEDVDDKNDPTYAPPHPKRLSDFTDPDIESKHSVHMSRQMAAHVSTVASTVEVTSSYVTSPKAELMKGVLHAVQSSQHPSVKLRSPSEKQLHSLNGFSGPPKRSRFHSTDSHTSRKHRAAFNGKTGMKSNIQRQKISVSTNTSLPGCPSDKCLYHPENPRTWSIEQVGEYVQATDCKNYATYFMDQEIDGESLLMLSRSTLMQFTNMKLGPTLKLSNYIAQLRARVGMSKHT